MAKNTQIEPFLPNFFDYKHPKFIAQFQNNFPRQNWHSSEDKRALFIEIKILTHRR